MSRTPPIPSVPNPPDPSTAVPITTTATPSPSCTTLINSALALRAGDRFATYAALGDRLVAHQRADHVCYWRRDSRTLHSARRKTARPIAARLLYYSVRLACVHGGQKFGRRGCGHRQKPTMRRDCPAYIALRATKCGQWLEVTAACNEHNHRCSRLDASVLPQNRTRLGGAERQQVVEMMRQGLAARTVLEHVHRTTGQAMTAKDLANLRRAAGVVAQLPQRSGPEVEEQELLATTREAAAADCRLQSAVDVDVADLMSEQPPAALMAGDDYYELVDERTIIVSDGGEDEQQPDEQRIPVRLESVVDMPETEAEREDEASVVTTIPPADFGMSDETEDQHSIIIETVCEEESTAEDIRVEAATSRSTVKRYRRVPGAAIRSQRLLRAQIGVLRAKKRKLVEETQILQLIKQQLVAKARGSGGN